MIAVWGASPGIGKSSLCAGLARWLAEPGCGRTTSWKKRSSTRPQYAAAAQEFQATVEPATLLAATRRFVESILAGAIDVRIMSRNE